MRNCSCKLQRTQVQFPARTWQLRHSLISRGPNNLLTSKNTRHKWYTFIHTHIHGKIHTHYNNSYENQLSSWRAPSTEPWYCICCLTCWITWVSPEFCYIVEAGFLHLQSTRITRMPGSQGQVPKRAQDALELKLQRVVKVLGINPGSSIKALSALNCGATSPAHLFIFWVRVLGSLEFSMQPRMTLIADPLPLPPESAFIKV